MFFVVSNAQVNTLYEGDSAKIIGLNPSSRYCHKVKNFDNDYYWSRFGEFYINYDDNLNILDTININIDFEYKYNNKLYSILYSYHEEFQYFEGDTIWGYFTPVVDSIDIVSYDILRNQLSYYDVDTNSILSLHYYNLMLDNHEGLFAVASMDTSIGLRLSLIDSMGNVVRSNTYNKNTFVFNLAQQEDKIILTSRPPTEEGFTMYYIDIHSLLIVDSMTGDYNFTNFKGINDSILVGTFIGSKVIYNTFAKTTNYFELNTHASEVLPPHVLDWNIEGKDPDSIILCYRTSTYDQIHSGIVISNFNHLGFINYEYVFNDYEPNAWKLIHGIHRTNDGGVVMNINTVINSQSTSPSNAYLLKFYPNGRLSLASVEHNKVALILYPNPTKDFINILSPDQVKEITIYNSLPQKVYTNRYKGKNIEINVSKFSKGNYIADIKIDKGNIRKKFIVE